METIFGSKLYGTDTDKSDTDYKGVYVPEQNELILQRVKDVIDFSTNKGDSKNDKYDVDRTYYSVQKFLRLASKGEFTAIDMLHANITNPTAQWKMIHENKELFYTKSMGGFHGYIKCQVAKYSIKGSRLNSLKRLRSELINKEGTLWDVMGDLTYDQNIINGEVCIFITGKRIAMYTPIDKVLSILEGYIEKYGSRAEEASNNQNIDWKAVSHAYRACVQLERLYNCGDIVFPLIQADRIKQIKSGSLDWNEFKPELEERISIVERLADISSYPDQVDQDKVDKLLLSIYEERGEVNE